VNVNQDDINLLKDEAKEMTTPMLVETTLKLEKLIQETRESPNVTTYFNREIKLKILYNEWYKRLRGSIDKMKDRVYHQ